MCYKCTQAETEYVQAQKIFRQTRDAYGKLAATYNGGAEQAYRETEEAYRQAVEAYREAEEKYDQTRIVCYRSINSTD